MSDKYVIAFDLGTSSMKAILMNQQGKIIASERRPLFPNFPQEGWAESDPVAWWDTACAISKALLQKSGVDPGSICGVSFDAPDAGLIPMSKEKGNLYPSIIWLDFRADAIAEEMNDQIAEATGDPEYRPFSGKDGIPKILWLKSHRPDLWDAMDCFIGDTGYMVYRATGELVCSCQCALCIALDIETRYWDLDLLGNFGIEEEKLPKIMQAVDIAGVLTETAAAELGLPPGLPVTAGFSDCTAIELGGGCCEPGDATLYIGTSMLFGATTDGNLPNDATGYTFCSSNPEHNMYLMTNDTSGGCIDWVVDKLFHPKDCGLEMEDCYKLVDDMLDHTEPGANHLFFSTWFSGERQPICDDYVRAGFWNMNLDHGRGHMVRAVYEGIAYEIRWALEKFEETHGLRYEKLRVSGGGAKSDRLMQIVADITGITVDVIEDAAFAVAKGTAFLGFIAAGILTYEDVRSLVHVKKSFAPRAEYKELYDNGSYFYQKYYETTKDFFRELNTKSNR